MYPRSMMRKISLGIVGLGILLAGCAKPTPQSAPTAGTSSGTPLKIAVIPKGTANSYWLTVKLGAEAAAAKKNATIVFNGPAQETDVTGQVDVVNNEITAGVNAIVLAACDQNALLTPAEKAVKAGIPVVTIDSGLNPLKDPSYEYIATDNVAAGMKAADALASAMGGTGKVGVLGFIKGAASNDQRIQGFLQGIKKYPGIQVVATLYDDSDTGKAVNQATNMLTGNPAITGIFAANQPGGQGAASFLKQSGKVGKVKVVSFDGSNDEITDLKDGILQALVVQNPYQMGYEGVMAAIDAINKKPAAKRFSDSGVTVVTMKNYNTPEVQQVLFPSKRSN